MLTDRTPLAEYHTRWQRAQKLCRDKGVDALVVWSRGGGTVDTSDDVIYLANYCGVFPYCPDVQPFWSGLSTAALVLPANGEPTLVVDTPAVRRDIIPVQDIRAGSNVPEKLGETLNDLGLGSARLGLVAGPWLLYAHYRGMKAACPKVDFVEMDYAVESLRVHKSPLEFQFLREAAEVGNAAMLAMMQEASRPGNSEADAVAAAYNIAIKRGSALIDAACASGAHSSFYAHGMVPNWTTDKLKAGDMFHCDMYGAAVEGYRWDFSRSVVCGGRPTAEQDEIYDGAIAAINAGVEAVRPGVKAGELWKVVNQTLVNRGIECGYPIHGHSYGLGWESPWLIPGAEAEIEPGMAIAVECMAGREPVGFVKFEHNLLVHQDKIELLSTCPERV